ncbi:hypothetical protein LNP74_26445 [Klebsiella pneumoniae subsp. pneumoniae]|nr:hypothetical protein [Klebsiella pneumoniae subsp. pneumoniae]
MTWKSAFKADSLWLIQGQNYLLRRIGRFGLFQRQAISSWLSGQVEQAQMDDPAIGKPGQVVTQVVVIYH